MTTPTFEEIISMENLLSAWKEFQRGKRKRKDVQQFQLYLMGNILSLHYDLTNKSYTHGGYTAFNISDPKPRNIHKASVRDRLLHHAIHRVLYPYFDNKFIVDSYSCRLGKGTHKATNRFRYFARKVSKNNTKQCHVLKCDIRKFFASIDHQVILQILKDYNLDQDTLWLLEKVIDSFATTITTTTNHIYAMAEIENNKKGLPLGNLTSQLLVNIYMNEFDQFVKHELHQKYYIRYADDFVILDKNKKCLESLLPKILGFLKEKLRLELHPNKVFIKTFSSGIDFLGWVNFPYHKVIRTSTKHRMFKRLENNVKEVAHSSYLGLLSHGDTYFLSKKLQKYKNRGIVL